jgi:uncharacterized membrane protein YqgA involved in biofilm formation
MFQSRLDEILKLDDRETMWLAGTSRPITYAITGTIGRMINIDSVVDKIDMKVFNQEQKGNNRLIRSFFFYTVIWR